MQEETEDPALDLKLETVMWELPPMAIIPAVIAGVTTWFRSHLLLPIGQARELGLAPILLPQGAVGGGEIHTPSLPPWAQLLDARSGSQLSHLPAQPNEQILMRTVVHCILKAPSGKSEFCRFNSQTGSVDTSPCHCRHARKRPSFKNSMILGELWQPERLSEVSDAGSEPGTSPGKSSGGRITAWLNQVTLPNTLASTATPCQGQQRAGT